MYIYIYLEKKTTIEDYDLKIFFFFFFTKLIKFLRLIKTNKLELDGNRSKIIQLEAKDEIKIIFKINLKYINPSLIIRWYYTFYYKLF